MKLRNKIIILTVLTSSIIACKKTLDTEPKNSLDLGFALSTREGLQATLISIYNSLQASGVYGRDLVVIPELVSDNCEITSNNTNRFLNQANNAPGAHINIWANHYLNINRANLILSNIDASTATASEKQQWKGEVFFLRALLYHNLIKVYARAPLYTNSASPGNFDLGVPIIRDPVVDVASITFPSRNKVSEVYDFIMQDIVQANTLLPATGGFTRPRRAAAQMLASRVELYRGNWAQSERWADSVIINNVAPVANASSYFTLSATAPGWGNNLPEAIFGLTYATGEPNPGTDGLQYIYYRNLSVSPAINGYADVTMQQSLRNDYGTTGTLGTTSDDLRWQRLVSIQTKSGQQVFFTLKWPGLKLLGQDDIVILRTSEAYLNRAEARAQQGGAKESGAISDLNVTRTRAGLVAFPTSGAGAPTGNALINEVLKERRIELAFEGHRVFDILRTGRDVMKSPANLMFGNANYNYLIAPILQADIDVNKNLTNNPGY
jgi:hypothetical protein